MMPKMEHFQKIEKALTELLASTAHDISDAEKGEVQHFIDVAEYGLALETFCAVVVDKGISVRDEVRRQIIEIQKQMSMKSPIIERCLGECK
jgi:hypothetical protein